MTKIITTHADLFKLLLAQMRATGEEVVYPASYTTYVAEFLTRLSQLSSDTDRLFPGTAQTECTSCGIAGPWSIFGAVSPTSDGVEIDTCNRDFAALALDLAARLPLGLTLVDVNTAMVIILGLDRMGLLRISGAGSTGRWETSAAGERDLGVRVRLS